MLTLVRRKCNCATEWRGASVRPTTFIKELGCNDFRMCSDMKGAIIGRSVDVFYVYQGVNLGGEFWRFIWKDNSGKWFMGDSWDVGVPSLQNVSDTINISGSLFSVEKTSRDLILKIIRI
jgi:hypothetical protein